MLCREGKEGADARLRRWICGYSTKYQLGRGNVALGERGEVR
jgi:hypothetical protein